MVEADKKRNITQVQLSVMLGIGQKRAVIGVSEPCWRSKAAEKENPMNAIVIEHVPVAELPRAWREQLGPDVADVADARVTVRIEAEQAAEEQSSAELADDPLFGMWREREDMADVAGYIRGIRTPRFNADRSRNKP
jgi:hypothetical protein